MHMIIPARSSGRRPGSRHRSRCGSSGSPCTGWMSHVLIMVCAQHEQPHWCRPPCTMRQQLAPRLAHLGGRMRVYGSSRCASILSICWYAIAGDEAAAVAIRLSARSCSCRNGSRTCPTGRCMPLSLGWICRCQCSVHPVSAVERRVLVRVCHDPPRLQQRSLCCKHPWVGVDWYPAYTWSMVDTVVTPSILHMTSRLQLLEQSFT
jgi:hypothetical protein